MSTFTQVNSLRRMLASATRDAIRKFDHCPLGSPWCVPHSVAHRVGQRGTWLCRIHDSMMDEFVQNRINATSVAAGFGTMDEFADRLRTAIEGGDDLSEHEDDPVLGALLDETLRYGSGALVIDARIADDGEPPPGTAPSYLISPEHVHWHSENSVALGSPDCAACVSVREQRRAAVADWERGRG